MSRRLLLVALCALAVLGAAPSAQATTTYRGQWQCSDRGAVRAIPAAEVELWARGWNWLPPEVSGRIVDRGHTGDDGSFSLQAPSSPDRYFVRVVLRDTRGLHVRVLISFVDVSEDSTLLANDRPVRDLAGIVSNDNRHSHSSSCALYGAFHDAESDYQAAVGSPPPLPTLAINTYVPFIRVPFTAPGLIQWPGDYDLGATPGVPSVPAHEFAHAFRFAFDGAFAHFLVDVSNYAYAQNHNICDRKNEGFAFNEGWAEYWSRQVTGQPDCPGAAIDDYAVEGRVAAALTDLEARCAGGSRATMVGVLRANPGTIHSFAAFRDHLPCPAPATPPPPPTAAGHFEPHPAASASAAALRARAATLGRDISALQRRLPAALRAAAHPPPCVHTPCLRTLAAETRAPGVRGEIAVLGVQRAGLIGLLSPASLRRLGALDDRALSRELALQSRALSRATARAGQKMLRGILAGARPVLRDNHSATTRRFARQMRTVLAQLGRATRGGRLPAGFAGIPTGARAPASAPVQPFAVLPPPAPPAPGPPTDSRADTKLTLSCPPSVAYPKPIDISGNLSPAVVGATVHVSYSAPKSGRTSHDVITDVNGDYHDSLSSTSSETYTVQAAWDGDGTHKAASAPACTVNVTP